MVRLFTEREDLENCAMYKPMPMYLQKAVLDPPDSIRNNPYVDNHRAVVPNYQAPQNVVGMAMNAQNMYGFSATEYMLVYNKLVDKEIKSNRKEIDRDLEEEPDEDAPGYYYNYNPQGMISVKVDDMLKEPRSHGYHESLEEYTTRMNNVIFERDVHAKSNKEGKLFKAPVGRPPRGKVWSPTEGAFVDKNMQPTIVENTQPNVLAPVVVDIDEIIVPNQEF